MFDSLDTGNYLDVKQAVFLLEHAYRPVLVFLNEVIELGLRLGKHLREVFDILFEGVNHVD